MKTALIIGAGPAGLTAAFELLTKTNIIPIIIEADKQVGGISKTIDYKGNKIDIGGHRFFSKSQKIIDWWLRFLPLDPAYTGNELLIQYQNSQSGFTVNTTAAAYNDRVMLVRRRKSRIFYNRKFFNYPLKLSPETLSKLGLKKTLKSGLSFLYSKIHPRKPELTLEDFFINRFGNELYLTFFKDYTQKVWGVPCSKIPASWGQQRVKDLDISKMLTQSIRSLFSRDTSIAQKDTSTSLIEQFLYPKFGPGQMWETVAEKILELGGQIHLNTAVTKISGDKTAILSVNATNLSDGKSTAYAADYFLSTMPIKDFFEMSEGLRASADVRNTALALEYRDFLIVGILSSKLEVKEKDGNAITDNWIYIQDKSINAGRLQFFHNWSPFMIAEPGDSWIGVEYFCNETDAFWNLPDNEIAEKAIREIESIGIVNRDDVRDTLVVRVKKAYPSYHGAYKNFITVQQYFDTLHNLFPIGRNGMHRYNNSDHSMLTAMAAVENIITGEKSKVNIWEINTDDEYHEDDKR